MAIHVSPENIVLGREIAKGARAFVGREARALATTGLTQAGARAFIGTAGRVFLKAVPYVGLGLTALEISRFIKGRKEKAI